MSSFSFSLPRPEVFVPVVTAVCVTAAIAVVNSEWYVSLMMERLRARKHKLHTINRPQRIILMRHGESEGNVDPTIYSRKPDNKIALTPLGREQAKKAGLELKEKVIGEGSVRFIVSPYERSRSTYLELAPFFSASQVVSVDEDPRVREQDWGNFQDKDQMTTVRNHRSQFGSFYYRCPNGESGADVYDRVSTFLETVNRFWSKNKDADNLVIVSHGLFCRLFLMRYFKWSVSFFESIWNLRNCEYLIMEKQENGRYELVTPLPGIERTSEVRLPIGATPAEAEVGVIPLSAIPRRLHSEGGHKMQRKRERSDTMF